MSCVEMHSICSVLGGLRKPKSRIGQNCDTVCIFEGVQERVEGSKTADRTHSLAFWGVADQNDEKPLVFDTFCEAGTQRAWGRPGALRTQQDTREGQKWV